MAISPQGYTIYILTNAHKNVLYIGVTRNLERRLWEHVHKTIPGFTAKYNINLLMYFETFQDIHQAIEREKQLKGWPRKKKNPLIAQQNPQWLSSNNSILAGEIATASLRDTSQ